MWIPPISGILYSSRGSSVCIDIYVCVDSSNIWHIA